MEISTVKIKLVAFHGIDHIRSKICICIYNGTEQVKCFKYLGYYMAYRNEKYICQTNSQLQAKQWNNTPGVHT